MTWTHSRVSSSWHEAAMVADLYRVVWVGSNRITKFDRTTKYTTARSIGSDESFYGHKSIEPFIPGVFKISPCLHTSYEITCSSGSAKIRGPYGIIREIHGQVAAFVTGLYGSPTIPPVMDDVPHHRHVIEATARSREGQMLIANTIAELPETISLLTPAINSFKKKTKRLAPRRTLRRVGSAFDYASSAWLSLRYGIIPTMNDIQNAMYIYDQVVNNVTFGGIRKSRAGETTQSPIDQVSFVRNAGPCYASGIEQFVSSTRWTATAYSRSRITLHRRLGLDIRSLLLSGYEGVPYSFVLDWAVDVGSWIAASIPSAEVIDLGNTLSQKTELRSATNVVSVATDSGMTDATSLNSLLLCKAITYERGCAIPIPAIPQVNLDMSRLSRRLDALSLAWQQASKGLPKR